MTALAGIWDQRLTKRQVGVFKLRPEFIWKHRDLLDVNGITAWLNLDGRHLTKFVLFTMFAMIHQHDIATDDADIKKLTAVILLDGRETKRKRQRVFRSPFNFDQQVSVQWIVGFCYLGEARRVTMGRIGVSQEAGLWP